MRCGLTGWNLNGRCKIYRLCCWLSFSLERFLSLTCWQRPLFWGFVCFFFVSLLNFGWLSVSQWKCRVPNGLLIASVCHSLPGRNYYTTYSQLPVLVSTTAAAAAGAAAQHSRNNIEVMLRCSVKSQGSRFSRCKWKNSRRYTIKAGHSRTTSFRFRTLEHNNNNNKNDDNKSL